MVHVWLFLNLRLKGKTSGKRQEHKDQPFGSGDCRVGWGGLPCEVLVTHKSIPSLERVFFLWDPDCLVQGPNSCFPLKSIREGASSLFGPGPERPQNISCSRATPRLHRCNLGVALEQEAILGLSGPGPKRLLAPSLIDFQGKQEFGPCTRQSGSQFFLTFRAFRREGTWDVPKCLLGFEPDTGKMRKMRKGLSPQKIRV